MKKKLAFLLLILLGTTVFLSCNSNTKHDARSEINRIIESSKYDFLLNYLYLDSDCNIDDVAAVLQVTPASIERLRNGETAPTEKFEEKIIEVSKYYSLNDMPFKKLRYKLDKNYSYFDYLFNREKSLSGEDKYRNSINPAIEKIF